jgi:hypothetical protein
MLPISSITQLASFESGVRMACEINGVKRIRRKTKKLENVLRAQTYLCALFK